MGHVVNYAYKLYDDEEWVKLFGSITQPYREEYRPQPFSRRFVRHLPGWYAQKHPDEDWAETFAVWMTPGSDWRADYARAADRAREARVLRSHDAGDRRARAARDGRGARRGRHAACTSRSRTTTRTCRRRTSPAPPASTATCARSSTISPDASEQGAAAETRPAGALIRKLERQLMADVFRWTGHFPEKTRSLMRDLAKRAEALEQVYPQDAESAAIVGVTILVTSLAMNFVHRGAYFPETVAAAAPRRETAAARGADATAVKADGCEDRRCEGRQARRSTRRSRDAEARGSEARAEKTDDDGGAAQ